MSAIQITSTDKKQVKRVATSFDRSAAFTQGYYVRPDVPTVIANAGVITLSQIYPVGRNALRAYIDGILLPQPGVDYTEDTPLQITLNASHVAALNPITSNIYIEWNRYLPGARDQSLEDLVDVIPDVSAAVRDPGTLRTSPATVSNVLITQDDLDTAITNLAGLTFVPIPTADRVLLNSNIPGVATSSQYFDLNLGNATASYLGGAFVSNSTYGGSGSSIPVPSGAKWALLSVMVDVDWGAGTLGSNDATVYAVKYGGTAVQITNRVARVSFNSSTESNGTDTGYILVELNDPALPTADLNVTYSVITPGGGAITLIYGVRLDGFYIVEAP